MAQPGHFSFRRILLSHILLLSVPVLLLGEFVTYKKARSSLEATVRQNLTESAIRKGHSFQESLRSLQANLITASESAVLQEGNTERFRSYLNQLQERLPTEIQCAQLIDLGTAKVVTNTCENQPQTALYPLASYYLMARKQQGRQEDTAAEMLGKLGDRTITPQDLWPQQQYQLNPGRSVVQITPAALVPFASKDIVNSRFSSGQLSLVVSVPIYNRLGELRYALSVQSALRQWERDSPRSLLGYTVVIDEKGTILAHPMASRVGNPIETDPDAQILQDIWRDASGGESAVRYLYGLEEKRTKWLAGYSPVTVSMTMDKPRTWVILAVTRLDNALYGLEGIKQILVVLTLGLLAAIFLATLYMSRDLSLPLEQLGKYASYIQQRHSVSRFRRALPGNRESQIMHSSETVLEQIPHNFKIRELHQLSNALHSMVHRLEERAEELEAAWQEAEAANKLKSEFLANTSHELRTPLNAIIGCLRLVQDGCCDDREEEIEFLQRADAAAVHLLSIINDLLDIAKIESGTVAVTLETVDLSQILREVIDLQVVPMQQKGLWLKLPDLSQPLSVEADAAKLKQVLINVLSNAVKFTEQGGITIATYIQPAQPWRLEGESRPYIVISVKDTGIGIDPPQQPKLFRPFVMADGTTTRKFEGTGLGLAISRNFMEMMGGGIALHSTGIGHGTTLEVRLPLLYQPQTRLSEGKSLQSLV